MRIAPPVTLSTEQRSILEQQARARLLPARQVERARIILRAADGGQNKVMASELGITEEEAARWRRPFFNGGIAALPKDASPPARPGPVATGQVQQIADKATPEKR